MRIAAAVIGFLTIAAVSGCSASSDSPEDKTDPSGRVFISTSVDGAQIPGGGPLTLDFSQAGRVSASAGCNTANGSVEFTDGKLTTGTMASTMMGCPPGIAESDSWTTTLLTAAPAWSLDGDTLVVPQLKQLLAYAKSKGVKVSLYPHTGFWAAQFEACVRVAAKVDDPSLGVTFNLCHWLKVEGSERDPLPLIKDALPRLNFVTINGADTGDTQKLGWDRLIQPLGRGSYDVGAFVAKVRAVGYRGPFGFQGYGIKMDAKELLNETMAGWKKMVK